MADAKKKAAPAAKEEKAEEKIIGILPALPGMNAHFRRIDENENPVDSARQVACLALVEDEDGDRKIRAVILDEISGPDIEAGAFQHVTV